jgi:hypothetical protein
MGVNAFKQKMLSRKLSASAQNGKLKPKESNWKLPGVSTGEVISRTRNGGNGRPSFVHRYIEVEESSESEAEEEQDVRQEVPEIAEAPVVPEVGDEDNDEEGSEEDDGDDEEEEKKPPPTRVALEVGPLTDLLQKHCRCPECDSRVVASMKSLCLATTITLTCTNPDCTYIDSMHPPATAKINATDRSHREDGKERMSDHAINLLYVLGFLSVGDGGTEAGRLLGLLGLPNDTTMERRSFGMIEERIAPSIKGLAEDIMLQNLTEEVKRSVLLPNDFDLWKRSLNGSVVLDKENYPRLRVSFDMAWQQRNSGNRYASRSGHALFVGGYTRLPIAFMIKSKLCNYCSTWAKKHPPEEPVPEHTCYFNHEGSSGAMEPIACLELTVELYRKYHCCIGLICADDDSSTRALLKWSNADYMKNNNTSEPPQVPITKGPNQGKPHPRPDRGRLPADIPEPSFVADPNHRKKVLTGELIALDKAKVSEKATMTRMDSTRIGKNFGYMIRTLKDLQECQYVNAGKAVLEHHFDNHDHCGPWCRRRTMSLVERQQNERYYRSKTTDAKLYVILSDKVSRFITFDRLKEVAHGMDTQVNESFNNTASWFAPKNKVYCGSCSLTNRLSIALGINTLGLTEYFRRLFKRLGIHLTRNVMHWLQMKDQTRSKRLARIKTKDKKKDRIKRKHEDLIKDEATAKRERAKRETVYKSGFNMQDEEVDDRTTADGGPRKTNRSQVVCPHCKLRGHATKRSKKCLLYTGDTSRAGGVPVAGDQGTVDPSEDVDRMDLQPLQQDPNQLDTEEDVEALHAFLLDKGTSTAADDITVGIVRATL